MASEMAARIGARLKKRREELGLNQREVSDRMHNRSVTNQHVSNWERGVYRPSDENLEDLAQALEVDVSFFYMDEPEEGTQDLMQTLSPNGDGPEDPASRIVSLLEQQNQLLADVAGGLGDLMAVVERARAEADARATAKPSGARKAAGS
jgi:transcriptional regulator with XRE-family HTH domain